MLRRWKTVLVALLIICLMVIGCQQTDAGKTRPSTIVVIGYVLLGLVIGGIVAYLLAFIVVQSVLKVWGDPPAAGRWAFRAFILFSVCIILLIGYYIYMVYRG